MNLDLIHEISPYFAAFMSVIVAILTYKYNTMSSKNKKAIDDHTARLANNEATQKGFQTLIDDQRIEIDRFKADREHWELDRTEWNKEREVFNTKCAKFQEDIFRLGTELENTIRDMVHYQELEKSFDLEKDTWAKERSSWESERSRLMLDVAKLSGALEAQSKAHNQEMDRINQRMIQLDKIREEEKLKNEDVVKELRTSLDEQKVINDGLNKQVQELQAEINHLRLEIAGYEKPLVVMPNTGM